MSAVVEAVSDVVESVGDAVSGIGDAISGAVEAVGDIGSSIVEAAGDVVDFVGDTVQGVVQSAVDDPLGTIAKVAAVATQQYYLLPVISATQVVAHGGSIENALTSAAISYATQGVTYGIGEGIADTAFGQALNEIGQSTGIESLPTAVARGLGTAATQTAAGVVQGQDIGDALTRGLTAGVGSGVGSAVTAEADINGAGTSMADRLLGSSVGAATTAALRGGDATTAAERALASGIVGGGINYAGNAVANAYNDATKDTQTAEAPTREETVASLPTAPENVAPAYPQLASSNTGTVSDASLTPTEEAIQQLKGSVTVYDPATGLPVRDAAEEANLNQLIAALYPETQAANVAKVDEAGNAYDAQGRQLGSADDFGLVQGTDAQGNTAWITAAGEVVKASPSSYNNEPVTDMGEIVITGQREDAGTTPSDFSLGDQEGDYPAQIINNNDGSTTIIEHDGSQRIFNVDGSVTFIGADGESKEEFGPKPEEAPVTEEKPASDGSLMNLAGALLGGSALGGGSSSSGGGTKTTGGTKTGTTTNKTASGGSLIPSLIGAGLGIYDNMTSGVQGSDFNVGQYGFGWNPNAVNAPVNARAYGQNYFNPTYTKAAEGGLMSIAPQYLQPTVNNSNYLQSQDQAYNSDPSNSVFMYARGGMAMNRGGISSLGGYSDGGRLLKGPGDGMSDNIPASIAGRQPARLANEEFVIPADVVSHLGNGSSEAGAKVLYQMMERVRRARTGNPKQGKQIDAHQYMPKVRK